MHVAVAYPTLLTSASGPEIGLAAYFGRILIGKASKSALRPALAGRSADVEAVPYRIRPNSGPEARFPVVYDGLNFEIWES